MVMTDLKESSPQMLSRRSVVKGLAGLTLILGGTGCTSSVSTTAHLTPTHTPPTPSPIPMTPTPTASPTPTPITVSRPSLTYDGHTGAVYAVVWHGTPRIVSGSEDRTAQVWNTLNGNRLLTYRGHTDQVGAVIWSPDGSRIASGSFDRTAQVWDSHTGNHILTYH